MLYKSFEIHYKIDTTHLRDYIHFKMNKIHIMDQPYESRLNSKLAHEKSISHPPKSIGGGGGGGGGCTVDITLFLTFSIRDVLIWIPILD